VRSVEPRSLQIATLLEAVPVPLLAVDAQGRVADLNGPAETLLGWEHDDLIGRPVEELVPEAMREEHREHRANFLDGPMSRRVVSGSDLRALHRDGTEIPVEIVLSPLATELGPLVLATIMDLRPRLAAETDESDVPLEAGERPREEIDRLQEALQLRDEELVQFATVASRDLRSPLRSVAGSLRNLEVVATSRLDDRSRGWIRDAVQGVDELESLLRDLAHYASVDTQARDFETVSMDEVFATALNQLDEQIRKLDAVVTSHPLPTVRGDRGQLVQVMRTLIGNGIHYNESERRRVHVAAEQSLDEWIFLVRDNGIGIPVRHHQRIFDIYQRLHTQPAYAGTGVGLSVCRRIVHRHGGRMALRSRPGEGSTFRFTLPREGVVR
jgi:PAS domain S-box-containing protein